MGDYTGLRFRAKLTDQASSAIEKAFEAAYSEGGSHYFWKELQSQGVKISGDFIRYRRRGFIPFGAVCYMPEDWGRGGYDFDPETKIWDVVCSAKDIGYHDKSMMETFCEEVLPLLIAEPCTAEILYEYWDEPKKVEVQPNKKEV